MELTKCKLGELITQRREKNDGSDLPICGVSKDGLIPPKQKDADTSIYNVFYRDDFIFNPARMELNSIAINDMYDRAICSSLYEVFYVHRTDLLLPHYLELIIRQKWFTRYCKFLGQGSAREYCRFGNISEIEIEFPPIEEQQKIVEYNTAIENRIALKQKINDNLQQQLCLIYENMMCKAQYGNIEGTFTVASKLTDVVTGKEDANFASPNGKYKFFTCSNDTLNCDEYVFDSSAILIAGNGDFNVKHYSGKFNAYQRTYVLIPDHQYYGLLYFASLYQINSFKSASSGSIVKFITKGDIENIPVFIPNDEHILNELNRLLALQEKNQAENEELSSLRDWLLPMLMNGQASISD